MTVVEALARKVSQLAPSRQLEVLHFVESLERKPGQAGPLHDPEGLLTGEPSNLSLEDFTKARREAWRNFPREM